MFMLNRDEWSWAEVVDAEDHRDQAALARLTGWECIESGYTDNSTLPYEEPVDGEAW